MIVEFDHYNYNCARTKKTKKNYLFKKKLEPLASKKEICLLKTYY